MQLVSALDLIPHMKQEGVTIFPFKLTQIPKNRKDRRLIEQELNRNLPKIYYLEVMFGQTLLGTPLFNNAHIYSFLAEGGEVLFNLYSDMALGRNSLAFKQLNADDLTYQMVYDVYVVYWNKLVDWFIINKKFKHTKLNTHYFSRLYDSKRYQWRKYYGRTEKRF